MCCGWSLKRIICLQLRRPWLHCFLIQLGRKDSSCSLKYLRHHLPQQFHLGAIPSSCHFWHLGDSPFQVSLGLRVGLRRGAASNCRASASYPSSDCSSTQVWARAGSPRSRQLWYHPGYRQWISRVASGSRQMPRPHRWRCPQFFAELRSWVSRQRSGHSFCGSVPGPPSSLGPCWPP